MPSLPGALLAWLPPPPAWLRRPLSVLLLPLSLAFLAALCFSSSSSYMGKFPRPEGTTSAAGGKPLQPAGPAALDPHLLHNCGAWWDSRPTSAAVNSSILSHFSMLSRRIHADTSLLDAVVAILLPAGISTDQALACQDLLPYTPPQHSDTSNTDKRYIEASSKVF